MAAAALGFTVFVTEVLQKCRFQPLHGARKLLCLLRIDIILVNILCQIPELSYLRHNSIGVLLEGGEGLQAFESHKKLSELCQTESQGSTDCVCAGLAMHVHFRVLLFVCVLCLAPSLLQHL